MIVLTLTDDMAEELWDAAGQMRDDYESDPKGCGKSAAQVRAYKEAMRRLFAAINERKKTS